MKPAPRHEFPAELAPCVRRAARLEWLTLAYLVSVVILMYLVMGNSQAMKTAWAEDLLSMVPPTMFLLADRYRNRAPNEQYPYGFHRVTDICFLVAALALLLVGGYLVIDSLYKLVTVEHPTIGMQAFLGIDAWLGWWMMAVLVWGTFPPIHLGRAKKKVADRIYDKILYTDALMNKADWLTAVAAMAGVLGIGFGLWWADAVAALFIAGDILHDGGRQIRDALSVLINCAPRELDGGDSPIPERILESLRRLDWVGRADIRLHEQGHLFYGEAFVQPRDGRTVPPAAIDAAIRDISRLDWRLQGLALTLTRRLER